MFVPHSERCQRKLSSSSSSSPSFPPQSLKFLFPFRLMRKHRDASRALYFLSVSMSSRVERLFFSSLLSSTPCLLVESPSGSLAVVVVVVALSEWDRLSADRVDESVNFPLTLLGDDMAREELRQSRGIKGKPFSRRWK